jgi:hypothetical protein
LKRAQAPSAQHPTCARRRRQHAPCPCCRPGGAPRVAVKPQRLPADLCDSAAGPLRSARRPCSGSERAAGSAPRRGSRRGRRADVTFGRSVPRAERALRSVAFVAALRCRTTPRADSRRLPPRFTSPATRHRPLRPRCAEFCSRWPTVRAPPCVASFVACPALTAARRLERSAVRRRRPQERQVECAPAPDSVLHAARAHPRFPRGPPLTHCPGRRSGLRRRLLRLRRCRASGARRAGLPGPLTQPSLTHRCLCSRAP